MLKKILNAESCAACRLCCIFSRHDAWETPVFTADACERIRAAKPETEFVGKDDGFNLKVRELAENELFSCPALTDAGCMLSADKPFDCRIWPYRIMEVGGRRAITIASICPELYNRPLSQLVEFLKEGLADEIFAYADKHPAIVKPYHEGYPVLLFENAGGNP